MKFVESLTGRLKSKPVDVDGWDEASIESSSVYTTSIQKGYKLPPVEESETEDKSGSNDDEMSRGSTIDTRKSIQSRLPYFKRNTKEKFYSADEESFTGSIADYEDYDLADLERQLQDINISKPSTKKDTRQLKKSLYKDPLEQAPTPSSKGNENEIDKDEEADFFCVRKESAKKFKCTIILVFVSCVFFLVSAVLILASYKSSSSSEGSKTSLEQISKPLPIIAEPTAAPSMEATIESTTAEECIDDMTGSFIVDTEFQDCSYLASHPASQLMFCNTQYDEIYELCKKTCKKC
jgi:hypothetical protein